MSGPFGLIVTDTSPLITLAVADELTALLRAGLPLLVPDAVYIEATRLRTAAGASRIIAWINDNAERVRIVPTEIGVDQQRRLEEGRPTRGMGEQAAIEVLDGLLARDSVGEALLLFEDGDLVRRRAILDARITLLSTGDLLRVLEVAGLIQSADRVLDEAARAGRNVDRQRRAAADSAVLSRLQTQLGQSSRRE